MINDSIRVIRRPRQAAPRRARTGALIIATAALALLAAACGSSTSSTGPGDSANATGAASSPAASVSPASACQHLLPNGGQPTNAQTVTDLRNAVRFAGCMRTHGVPNFPDPASDGGRVNLFASASAAGIDMSSPRVMAAANRCQSLLHINLESIGMG